MSTKASSSGCCALTLKQEALLRLWPERVTLSLRKGMKLSHSNPPFVYSAKWPVLSTCTILNVERIAAACEQNNTSIDRLRVWTHSHTLIA